MFNSLIKLFTTVAPDFEVLWLGARDLLTQKNPYLNLLSFTGNANPPNTMLFYIPFALVNYPMGQSIFLSLSFLAIFFCLILSFRILEVKPNLFSFSVAVFLVIISFPTKFTLGMGQSNFIVFALLLSSYLSFKKGKLILSGILLGLSFAYKAIFIYFLLFFIFKKSWKVVTYALITFLLSVCLIYIITVSLDLYTYYFTQVVPLLLNFSGREIYYNQGIAGFVSRLITDINVREIVTGAISLILVGLNLYLIGKSRKTNLVFSITSITLLLIDSLSWQHHFVWMIFPFLCLWKEIKNHTIKRAILLTGYALISINVPALNFAQSHVFWGTLFIYLLN